jgi:hypothetical protein
LCNGVEVHGVKRLAIEMDVLMGLPRVTLVMCPLLVEETEDSLTCDGQVLTGVAKASIKRRESRDCAQVVVELLPKAIRGLSIQSPAAIVITKDEET